MVGIDANGVVSFNDARIPTPQLNTFHNTCELFMFGCGWLGAWNTSNSRGGGWWGLSLDGQRLLMRKKPVERFDLPQNLNPTINSHPNSPI